MHFKWASCICEFYLSKTVKRHASNYGLEKQVLKQAFEWLLLD